MYSLSLKIDALRDKIAAFVEGMCFRWKSGEDPAQYGEARPKVYAYTYDETRSGMPIFTPSVLLQCLSMDEHGKCEMLVHCCVCNPAMQCKEVTHEVADGVFEYGSGDNITSGLVRSELYRACLLLGEQIYLCLLRMKNDGEPIDGVALSTPSPYMENFPYCECAVSFNVSLASDINARCGARVSDLL